VVLPEKANKPVRPGNNNPRPQLTRKKLEPFHFPQIGDRDLTLKYQCHRCVRGFANLDQYRTHYHRHDLESPDLDRAFVCFRCMSFESGYEADIRAHGKDCSVPRHEDDVSKFKYYCFFCDPAPMEFNTSSELGLRIAASCTTTRRLKDHSIATSVLSAGQK